MAALLGLLAGGCSTTAGRCEDVCEYTDKCGLDPVPDCPDKCEDGYDDASDACQDSFDAYADCLSDHDLDCSDACDGATVQAVRDCSGQIQLF